MKLEKVVDRNSFLEFTKSLVEDWAREEKRIEENKNNSYSPISGNSEWQNGTIGSYLEAAASWAEDSAQFKEPSWKDFAKFLYAGKNYE
jgi:hypothetical protein